MMDWLQSADWSHVAAIVVVIVAALLGVILTLLTLPGTWVLLCASLLVKLWQPGLMPWWVLVAAGLLAVVGEAIEFFASALGAAKGGASRRGAIGAVLGSVVGAVAGSPFLFPLGTIVGGVVGAAAGTMIAERGTANKTWAEASRAGGGAAAGRLVATVAKTGVACVMALTLGIAVFFK
ncbi:MAG: DUF456 domain-containing protein [Phycisphaerales bacterium]